MEWTTTRRYDGDTRSAWFADADGRKYSVVPTHGTFLVCVYVRGSLVRGDYVYKPVEGRDLAERWHRELLARRRKRQRPDPPKVKATPCP